MRARGRAHAARRTAGPALALIAALVLACAKNSTGPIVPDPVPPALPERIEAVFPEARSQGTPYDTPIWVQFSVPVDTATVNDHTVFFKLDTQRLAASLLWDPATRRLRIVPVAGLSLRRTYTVELAASIRFTDGSTLGVLHRWQFTTNSLRRPHSPLPMDGRIEQSPFVTLQWGGATEPAAGPVLYEIHVGSDPAGALDPAQPPVGTSTTPRFVPRVRWPQDGPVYWSVHARNTVTGERFVGPAWRFETFPADAAYDSIPVGVIDWNWLESNNPGRQRCTEDSLVMSTNIVCTIRWDFSVPDTNVRLVGASIDMSPRYASVAATAGASVWYTSTAFPGCAHGFPGPPITDEVNGRLAESVVLRSNRIRFASDALTAHVEATRRLGGYFGYLFRGTVRRGYFGPGAGNPNVAAVLWLYTYRPTQAASLAGGRADR